MKFNNEKISVDLAERMKFVLPDLRARESVYIGKKIGGKPSKDGHLANGLKDEVIATDGSMAVFNVGSTINL